MYAPSFKPYPNEADIVGSQWPGTGLADLNHPQRGTLDSKRCGVRFEAYAD